VSESFLCYWPTFATNQGKRLFSFSCDDFNLLFDSIHWQDPICTMHHYCPLTHLRLSATVTPKFFPLYHFFASHHQHFIPYFFISRSGSPYILSLYPTTTIKYHYPTLLIIYYLFSPIKNSPYA
jgi:hypothetical protein